MVIDHAAVDADPADLAGEAAIFDLWTAVHHHLQAGILGDPRRLVVAHAQLHPHYLGANGDGLARNPERGIRLTEHVDHIDRFLDVGKRSEDLLPEQLLAGMRGIDWNDPIVLGHEIFHGEVTRPRLGRARAYERKGAAVGENVTDIGVAVAVVVHASPRASHARK